MSSKKDLKGSDVDTLKARDDLANFIYGVAEMYRVIPPVPTPTEVVADLLKIEKALTIALQTLIPLRLQHRYGQDMISEPYNSEVAATLSHLRVVREMQRCKGLPADGFEDFTYPSNLIGEIIEFRDVAKYAIEHTKPGRGNSSSRNRRTAIASNLGKSFVFRHRMAFGEVPPVSKTGWSVDVLTRALQIAGLEDFDASDILRRSIKRHKGEGWVVADKKPTPADRGPAQSGSNS